MPAGPTIRVEGTRELTRALVRAGALAMDALASAVFEEQSAIMTASQSLVPVDLGTLKASGTVLPPVVRGDVVECDAGYGGAAAAYALVQHEGLFTHTVGERKYLERPFLERSNDIPKNLARRVVVAWRRLST